MMGKHVKYHIYLCHEIIEGIYVLFVYMEIDNVSIFKCKNNIIVSVRRLVQKIVWKRSVG